VSEPAHPVYVNRLSSAETIGQAPVVERPVVLPPARERVMAANPQEFCEFARECLRWANETQSERHRQELLEMSKTWFQAALELEQFQATLELERRWDLRDDTTMIRRSTPPRAA
jgi:hypothetical protein